MLKNKQKENIKLNNTFNHILINSILGASILLSLQACNKMKPNVPHPGMSSAGSQSLPQGAMPSNLPDSQLSSPISSGAQPLPGVAITSGTISRCKPQQIQLNGQTVTVQNCAPVQTGAGMMVISSIGEPISGSIQTNAAKNQMQVIPNIKGTAFSGFGLSNSHSH